MIKNIIPIILMFTAMNLNAQHQEINEKVATYKGEKDVIADTTSLISFFKRGHVNGHFRYFFMSTDNAPGLTDYYANAGGGGIHYETAKFHGLQIGISGFYIFNLWSSDLGVKDPITNQSNRYEIGLFDIENPNNHKDIDRLEELHIKYHHKKSHITFGRQLINTPFINLQDGRMRPTSVEGIWLESKQIKNLKVEGGWIYEISPRSTTKWYSNAQSVGIYPMGVNIEGEKSDYLENIESKGVGLIGLSYKATKSLNITLWDTYFDNVMNTAMLQADLKFKTNTTNNLIAGIQFIRQDAVNNGGNLDQTKTYINKGKSAMVIGSKLGWTNSRIELSANYTHITKSGRYLMPREWGRDPFYTFMPRERNEGFGNVHAIVGKVSYNLPKKHIKTSLAAGYFKLPDVKDYEFNKYGMPSYSQINADVRYEFDGFFKGLDAHLLIGRKINHGETYDEKKFEFNKVNMVMYNFVLNYHF